MGATERGLVQAAAWGLFDAVARVLGAAKGNRLGVGASVALRPSEGVR
jgi:hypothetical protein